MYINNRELDTSKTLFYKYINNREINKYHSPSFEHKKFTIYKLSILIAVIYNTNYGLGHL